MNCDKCNLPVHPSNDAVQVECVAYSNYVGLIMFNSRHFLPTENCAGSPSRAQYIEGQPRDSRGYPYDESEEARWREAYRIVKDRFDS